MPKKKKRERSEATLTERAYHSLKRAILTGEIPEGSFLMERAIRERYGVGRTPFREACNRLHNEHILEAVPHRGYYVSELSFRGVQDMFEARLLLESAVAELAAVRATNDQIVELDELERRLMECRNSNAEYEKVVRINTEFHLCLARMTQNRELVELLRKILDRNERVAYLEYQRSGFRKMDIRMLHGSIVESVRRHDAEGARKAVAGDIIAAREYAGGSGDSGSRETHQRKGEAKEIGSAGKGHSDQSSGR